jgi:NAD kinase
MQIRETRHAMARRQGRGVPPFVVNLLLEQGACTRHNGADVFYVDKETRRRLRRTLGDRIHAALESYLDAYVVLGDDGHVITTAWRTRRLRRA